MILCLSKACMYEAKFLMGAIAGAMSKNGKIGYIADYEGRSVNSQVLVLIRENIKAFEEKHGFIETPIPPYENVKPTK